jgi:hypothetical protein
VLIVHDVRTYGSNKHARQISRQGEVLAHGPEQYETFVPRFKARERRCTKTIIAESMPRFDRGPTDYDYVR